MSLADEIRRVDQEIAQMKPVVQLSERVLREVMKPAQPPADLEKVRGSLGAALDLLKHGEQETARQFLRQAAAALQAVRPWLAEGDLGISPFLLRRFLETHPADRSSQHALIRYFLTKQPHTESDRDKLDYLLSSYFGGGSAEPAAPPLPHPEELRRALKGLFAGVGWKPLSPAVEIMLHELESLVARIDDFTDFNQLVEGRLVERVRGFKSSLGEEFYHPQLLSAVIRFNVNFRRHFETLFHRQLDVVRQETRRRFEEVWEQVRAIEDAYERLCLPEAQRALRAVLPGEEAPTEAGSGRGRPLEAVGERPAIDRLVRRGQPAEKESELPAIVHRIARFLEKLSPEQLKAEKAVFPLHEAKLELAAWEREAFRAAAMAAAPESTRTIQYALAVVAWLEEEMARYQETRADRYLWKTHFDHLSYAVERSVELLKAVRGLLREGASEGEAAWFESLVRTALRLATALNRVAPVFEAAAAA
ncbi:MAG: hypothetical protein ACE5HL_04760 [Terriglobia bacterium]